MSLLPPAYLAKKLTRSLPMKGGSVVRTIADASRYILALPKARESCRRWLHMRRLVSRFRAWGGYKFVDSEAINLG
jgi:hypothetical protein